MSSARASSPGTLTGGKSARARRRRAGGTPRGGAPRRGARRGARPPRHGSRARAGARAARPAARPRPRSRPAPRLDVGPPTEEYRREPGGRNFPQLDGDGRAALRHADHRRMPVVDRPEAVVAPGRRLARDGRPAAIRSPFSSKPRISVLLTANRIFTMLLDAKDMPRTTSRQIASLGKRGQRCDALGIGSPPEMPLL